MVSFFQQWLVFFSDNPAIVALQAGVLFLGVLVIFLVFFTTRDILLRTRSLIYQLLCIVLVAVLPIVGFFLYLLIRPARTVKERAMEEMLEKVLNPSVASGE